jgi:hypothetical protein
MSKGRFALVVIQLLVLFGVAGCGSQAMSEPADTWLKPSDGSSTSAATGTGGGSETSDDSSDQYAVPSDAQLQAADEARLQREATLTAALKRYDEQGSVDLAVSVIDRKTGQTFSYNGTGAFAMASIVKVDILASLLLQTQQDGRALTAQQKTLATSMIEASDNDAATTLWKQTGGISTSTTEFGLSGTVGNAAGSWGLSTTTADDQVKLMNQLADPNGPVHDADYLLDLMSDVDDDQDWGISAAADPGEDVAVKNGWLAGTTGPGWIINSMGRITDADTDLAVIVLSRGQSSFAEGVDMVESVAKLIRAGLGW